VYFKFNALVETMKYVSHFQECRLKGGSSGLAPMLVN
jgi:hypothetical protein